MHRYQPGDRDQRFQDDRNYELRPYQRNARYDRGDERGPLPRQADERSSYPRYADERASFPRYEDDVRSATRMYGHERDESMPRNFGEWRESTRQEPNFTREMLHRTGANRGYADAPRPELPQDYSDFRPARTGENSRGGSEGNRESRGYSSAGYGSDREYGRGGQGQMYGGSAQNRGFDTRYDSDKSTSLGGAFSSMGGTSSGAQYTPSRSSASFAGKGPKGYLRSDERIRESVCECLENAHEVDASDIEVEVRQGEVTLKGTVGSRSMKRWAEDHVEALPGVRDVTNSLRVRSAESREDSADRSNERSNSPSSVSNSDSASSGTSKNSSRAGSSS